GRPISRAPPGGRDDRWSEGLHVPMTEHGLDETTMPLPGGALAGQQPVPEEGLQRPVGERLDIAILVMDQNVFGVLRTTEKVERAVAGQRYPHGVSVPPAELSVYRERVAEHLRPIAHCLHPRRSGGYCRWCCPLDLSHDL